MAKGRMLLRACSSDPRLAQLSPDSQLLHAYASAHMDRDGRVDGMPLRLRAQAVPYLPWTDAYVGELMEEWTKTIEKDNLAPIAQRYCVAGVWACQLDLALSQQRISYEREAQSLFPPPPKTDARTVPGQLFLVRDRADGAFKESLQIATPADRRTEVEVEVEVEPNLRSKEINPLLSGSLDDRFSPDRFEATDAQPAKSPLLRVVHDQALHTEARGEPSSGTIEQPPVQTEPEHAGGSASPPGAHVAPLAKPVRDELWETWVAEVGEPETRSERSRLNAALKELREIGATGEGMRARIVLYRRRYGRDWPLTPQALTGNWSSLGEPTSPTIEPRRHRYTRA